MGLPIQHSLVQVGNAPPLGDIEAEGGGQLSSRRARSSVAPGAERRQQLPSLIERLVAVHHGGNADAAYGSQRCAMLLCTSAARVA